VVLSIVICGEPEIVVVVVPPGVVVVVEYGLPQQHDIEAAQLSATGVSPE
jgi:hypothetical protein